MSDVSNQQLVLLTWLAQMVSPLISIHVLALVDPYCVPDESASHRVRPCAWPGVFLGQSGSAVRHQWAYSPVTPV